MKIRKIFPLVFIISFIVIGATFYYKNISAATKEYKIGDQGIRLTLGYCDFDLMWCYGEEGDPQLEVESGVSQWITMYTQYNDADACISTTLEYPSNDMILVNSASRPYKVSSEIKDGSMIQHSILTQAGGDRFTPTSQQTLMDWTFYINPSQPKTITLYQNVEIYDSTCTTKQETLSIPLEIIVTTGSGEQQPSDKLTDINGDQFETYIRSLANELIVSGYSDNTYRSGTHVTRNQMAKFVTNAFNFTVNRGGTAFPDVPINEDAFNPIELAWYVQTLKNLEIISGYSDGYYKPENLVTRGQVTKYIVNSLIEKGVSVDLSLTPNYPDVPADHTFAKEIAYLSSVTVDGEKVIRGYSNGNYGPDDPLTRGQMAKIIDNSRKILD
ncbi:hypothetical protein GF362_06505 [Candidatus Dojkabacteria bacterium]|nr:hypothetical protein [Candidatus Dojkabacteria bacterium]